MASSMKDIKLRIHSVESTMQITRAMELVAASKLRRAQERMERSRPYFEILHETIHDIAGLDDTILSPYVMQTAVWPAAITTTSLSLYTLKPQAGR